MGGFGQARRMPQVRVLARVELGDAEADRALGGGQARELLAYLVARRGRPATTAHVIDALWPDEPPATASTIVHGLIRRIRQCAGPEAIVRDDRGYRLVLSAEDVDLWSLDEALADNDVDTVRARWQEPAFGVYADRPWAQEAVAPFVDLVRVTEGPEGRVRARHRVPVSRLVGRRRELHSVTAALRRSRLVTLVGLGGVGKTRLALEVLRHVPHGHQAFVDLGAGVGPVANRVAADLGLAAGVEPERNLNAIASLIGREQQVLLLDGCEHDREGAARTAEALLSACPELTIIATARVALGVPGEHVVPVLPFASPGDPRGDAVELLLDRAQSMGLAVTNEDRERAAVICRRCAGVPLAIELGVAELLFGTGPPVSVSEPDPAWAMSPERAVDDVVRHAVAQLSEAACRTACRAALLPAGFTPEMAATICPEGAAVAGILHELLASGLVAAETAGDTRRFRFLDRVREALLGTADDADRDVVRRALLDTFAAVRPDLLRPADVSALTRAVGELPNGQALLAELKTQDRALERLELVTAMSDTWADDGHWAHGVTEITAALQGVHPEGYAVEGEEDTVAVDPLTWAYGVRAWSAAISTYDGQRRLVPHLLRAVEIATDAGDSALEARLRHFAANGLGYSGDVAAAEVHAARMAEIAEQLDSEFARLGVRSLVGGAHLLRGDPAAARRELTEVAEQLEALGARSEAARVRRPLAMACQAQGDTEAAIGALEQAERLALAGRARGTLAMVRAHIADLRFTLADQRPETYLAALEAVLVVGNPRAAGILRTRLGQLTRDPATVALGTIDLWTVDQPWVAGSLATLLTILPPDHPLQASAPPVIAALSNGWGTPLEPYEADLVEPHRAAHHEPPPEGWEEEVLAQLRALAAAG